MSSINKVILIGLIKTTPETIEGVDGPGLSFKMATYDEWRDRQTQELQVREEEHRVVIWDEAVFRQHAEVLVPQHRIFIEGEVQTRKIQENGSEKSVTEVVVPRYRGKLVFLPGPVEAPQGLAHTLNRVLVMGNLGKKPESQQFVGGDSGGSGIVHFSVATSEILKSKVGERREQRTEWHRVTIFNDRLSDIATRFLDKGSKVFLVGQLRTRLWTDRYGQEQSTTEVILPRYGSQMTLMEKTMAIPAGSMPSSDIKWPNNESPQPSRGSSTSESSQESNFDDFDDEIPF